MKNEQFLQLANELVDYLARYESHLADLCQNVVGFCTALDVDASVIKLELQHHANATECSQDDQYSFIETGAVLDTDAIPAQPSVSAGVVVTDVDIMLHPVYEIPAPYITRSYFVSTGQLLDVSQFQNIVDSLSSGSTARAGDGKTSSHVTHGDVADNRSYQFGRLNQESHPVTDRPCWSMHICVLEDIMRMGLASDTCSCEGTGTLGDTKVKQDQERLYLLNWLSLVGPHFGFTLRPEAYKDIAALIMRR
jgi:hypothetical protein